MNQSTPSRDRFATYAWIVIVANVAVILWGAVVRATGSGAGCGSHWPLCNGEVVPPSASTATLIEFSHRLTSGVALVMVLVLLVWSRRARPPGHPARLGAGLSMFFMLGEAAVGAGLVLFELVAENESIARALFMSVHLVNTFLLLAALTLTAYWASGGAAIRWRGERRFLRLVAVALLGTLLIGVSGAVAALGDTLFPPTSLAEELRKDLSPTAHILQQLRVLHPLIAVAVSLALLQLVAAVRQRRLRAGAGERDSPASLAARRHSNQLNLLVFVQLAVGSLNIVLLAPVWMQLVHLLLADLLWIALVLTCAASLAAPAEATAEARERAPSAAAAVAG